MIEKQGSEKMKLNIAWLYPRQMSTYGDRGNILTLWKRASWRGIHVSVREFDFKEKVDPTRFDLYFFGGGQDQAQRKVSDDLIKYKRDDLRKAARLGAVFLGICGGYQLMGNYYRPFNEPQLDGIGLLDVVTVASNNRMIGNVIVQLNKNIGMEDSKLLVGFENHSGKTYVGKKSLPLGSVVVGNGNNGEDRSAGAFNGNVFGCYLHGPVLAKNPHFADLLLTKALSRRYNSVTLPKLDDTLETNTHNSVIDHIKRGR